MKVSEGMSKIMIKIYTLIMLLLAIFIVIVFFVDVSIISEKFQAIIHYIGLSDYFIESNNEILIGESKLVIDKFIVNFFIMHIFLIPIVVNFGILIAFYLKYIGDNKEKFKGGLLGGVAIFFFYAYTTLNFNTAHLSGPINSIEESLSKSYSICIMLFFITWIAVLIINGEQRDA